MEIKFKILGFFDLQYQRRLETFGPPLDMTEGYPCVHSRCTGCPTRDARDTGTFLVSGGGPKVPNLLWYCRSKKPRILNFTSMITSSSYIPWALPQVEFSLVLSILGTYSIDMHSLFYSNRSHGHFVVVFCRFHPRFRWQWCDGDSNGATHRLCESNCC